MSALRESARRLLGDDPVPDLPRAGRARTTDRFSAPPELAREGSVERVTIDVRVEGALEQVTLVLREGALSWTCTDGTVGREGQETPSSPFVRAALRWVSGSGDARLGEPARAPARAPVVRVPDDPSAVERELLADALDDVVVAVVRAGLGGLDSPTVRDALERARRARTPLPLALSRWLGRLERAMGSGDARSVARLLDGAGRAATDLRGARSGPTARARAAPWGGDHRDAQLEPLVDREMVEIAREWLDGAQRAAIERRYLVDLASGEILCEERGRVESAPSLGPCPRSLVVSLGEIEVGPAPRRVRVLQYTVSLTIAAADLEKVQAHAVRRVSTWVDAYREAMATSPALAEPVQLVACAGVEEGFLVDSVGEPIPVARTEDPGAADALDQLARSTPPTWIFGRLVELDGAIRIIPCACGDSARVTRLR